MISRQSRGTRIVHGVARTAPSYSQTNSRCNRCCHLRAVGVDVCTRVDEEAGTCVWFHGFCP